MDQESDFLPNECGRGVDGGVDRISELPDEIIVVILSFLRLREAAATSVLSSRWSDLWKHTPNLNFDKHILRDSDSDDDDDDYSINYGIDHSLWDAKRDKYIEIVNSVIHSHKSLSLKQFSLALPVNKIAKCTVAKWLEFVFSRQVESLKLKFISNEEDDDLVLAELLRESIICLQPQTDLIFFQSLKRLRLRCLKVSGEDIELFLRNCPLLEQLTIHSVTLTSDVQLCGANLVLKHLEICSCSGVKSIKVSAPNLTYMTLGPYEGEHMLLLENVQKLVQADFLVCIPDIVVQWFASSASCNFSQLQILKLLIDQSKRLHQLQVILTNRFQMPNLKKLGILCPETYNHSFLPVTALIWAFPRLEEFKLTYGDLDEEEPAYMQVMTDVGRSPHLHLKVFELQMSRRQNVNDHIAELVMYISNNCVALQKIIIDRRAALVDQATRVDPATRDLITQQLQGKVPNHIQLELFNKFELYKQRMLSLP